MCNTSTFWKCVWFENIRSVTKVMSVKVKNVTWRFCPFSTLEWSNDLLEELLPISSLSWSRIVPCRASTFHALSHSVLKCWHAFWHTQEWQAIAGKWRLSHRKSYTVPAKWREKNGAKMTSRSRQKFPAQMSETKRVNITLPRFCFLIAADLTPKESFEQLFDFQGPVISECTNLQVRGT